MELTHKNYPNHIDKDGKPIVGSDWIGAEGSNIKIITGVGILKMMYMVKGDGDNEYYWNIRYFLKDSGFKPYTKEITLFEKAVEEYQGYDLLEISSSWGVLTANSLKLIDYLYNPDCRGFIYKNEYGKIFHYSSIVCHEDLTPIAVCMKKKGK